MSQEPVPCVVYESRDALVASMQPGGIFFDLDTHDCEDHYAVYCCPCGCGSISTIHVGRKFKPVESPSWEWNGDTTKPTLMPSLNRHGHWHGWLRNGEWVSV